MKNIIVAQEMLHSMHHLKGKRSFFEIKVDLEKAYDMISWIFVDKILTEVGIPIKLKGVIMEAIITFKMSVVWSGEKSISTPGKG